METNFKLMKSWRNFGIKLVCFCLVIITLGGCGTRTVETQKRTIETTALERNENIELKQNSTFNDIFSLNPIDNTKPIIINGKSYYNASITFDKSIKNEIEIKGSENLSYSGSSEVLNKKNTEKKDNTILWIGIVFVIALFVFLYIILKKYKIL